MKRGKPLRRKTRLRARSKTKKYARRVRDTAYMLDVKRLPCVVRSLANACDVAVLLGMFLPVLVRDISPTNCEGRVQADHAGTRALSQKAADDTCIPLCKKHHGERTDYRATFKNWDGATMRAFNDWAIEHTRREVSDLRSIVGHVRDRDAPKETSSSSGPDVEERRGVDRRSARPPE